MVETNLRQAYTELRESGSQFRQMLQNIELLALLRGSDGLVTECNEQFLRLTGWREEDILGRDWFELCVPSDVIREPSQVRSLLSASPIAWHLEAELLTRSGERRLIRWNNSVLRSDAGAVIGTVSIGEDITERGRAEARFLRLKRLYAVLSDINALIIRVQDRMELFNEACRIAVEAGAFKRAWIGMVDPGTGEGSVVAWRGGEHSQIDGIKLTTVAGTPDSEQPACRALRTMQPVICNDLATDPSVAAIRGSLMQGGGLSLGCFPILVLGRPVAVITLIGSDSGLFDDEETRLLLNLAGDIAFALEHIERARTLNYVAYYDVVTGLANRSLFLDRVTQYIRSAEIGARQLAVLLIDLERFKSINDSLGRPAGDALLRQIADWLKRTFEDPNLIARVGSDLFAVVLPELAQPDDLLRILDQAVEQLEHQPFYLNDAVFSVAAKGGAAVFPGDGVEADILFRNAEAALKKAKGGNERLLLYVQSMSHAAAGRLTLENRLRHALDRDQFVLYYQPKLRLRDGTLCGAEALMRWHDGHAGLVLPAQFIPTLEDIGLIHEVGRWALREAIADHRRWRVARLAAVRIAVNVSPLQMRRRDFVTEIRQMIGEDAGAASGLELELTESLLMEDVKHSIACLMAIRELKVCIAIDDFGTGFSSLNYLAKLPVDVLKIDQSFVAELGRVPESLALVSTIVKLAHSLKLTVVAEGVETEEQFRLLRLLNCDEAQGYLLGRPMPCEAFEATYLAPSGTGLEVAANAPEAMPCRSRSGSARRRAAGVHRRR